MLESEAMALLVSAVLSYKNREAALALAGSALAVLQDAGRYAAQLGDKGVAQVRRAWLEREERLGVLEEKRMHILLRGEKGYPPLLEQIEQPPHLLYVWGSADLADPFPVAMVGTRRASAYGVTHTRKMARELAQAGVCVVSGLALGIDASAHEGALDAGGRTLAVLGSALDEFYPEENRALMERMLASGGSVVSEYPPGTAPTKYSFLQRNRIIAGIALGTLVTEAPRRSGASRTAQCALEDGREVFALPGSVDSPGSVLPHLLIADGARLVTSARDILSALVIEPKERAAVPRQETDSAPQAEILPAPMQEDPPKKIREARLCVPPGLEPPARAICEKLLSGEADFDTLCAASGLESDEAGALLIELEMDGILRQTAGDSYVPGDAMHA